MSVQTPLRLADLEHMPDDPRHRELVEGELIELPPPEWSHSLVARRIFKLIDRAAEKAGLGLTLMEAGFKISGDDRNWVQPDVSFILAGRVPRQPEPKFFSGAPDLAVEVISPSETAEDVNRKIELLLR
ncbi:MAG: Uma2 family endonuclease, partial [Bryobacteraceae bacterium]